MIDKNILMTQIITASLDGKITQREIMDIFITILDNLLQKEDDKGKRIVMIMIKAGLEELIKCTD